MAITLVTVWAGPDSKIVDVSASLDADTTATIPHGLGATPEEVDFVKRSASGRLSGWFVSAKNATNVVLTKGTTEGSAGDTQIRVNIRRPHSIGR